MSINIHNGSHTQTYIRETLPFFKYRIIIILAGSICGPVCAIYCEFGNVFDENGCATCDCNEPCKVRIYVYLALSNQVQVLGKYMTFTQKTIM